MLPNLPQAAGSELRIEFRNIHISDIAVRFLSRMNSDEGANISAGGVENYKERR